VALAAVGISALVVAALGLSGCPRNCVCPTDMGVAEVPLPAATQSNPIVKVSTDASCTAAPNAAGGVTIYTSVVTSCAVLAELENGDVYGFTVEFYASNDSCCPGVGGFSVTAPVLVSQGADAGPPGCGATCATPAGTVQPLNDYASVAAALEGRWEFCTAWPTSVPGDALGIEFDTASVIQMGPDGGATLEGGNAYYLVNGPSGLVRGAGFAYQVTYDFEQSTTGTIVSTQVDIHPTPNSGFGGSIRYSPCPRELELDFVDPGTGPSILVPVGN
jgi:hypothetical protein